MFNIRSNYFSFFNNKPTASWVAHATKEFLTCYYCSYYSSIGKSNKNEYFLTQSPSLNINLTPFYLSTPPPPPQKNKTKQQQHSDHPLQATPLKILENLTRPLLKCTFIQKSEVSFFQETKDFISNNEIRKHLNVEVWINLKIEGELGLF